MSQTTKDLIELAIETVSLNGGTIIVEDEKQNKKYHIFKTSNSVQIRIQ